MTAEAPHWPAGHSHGTIPAAGAKFGAPLTGPHVVSCYDNLIRKFARPGT